MDNLVGAFLVLVGAAPLLIALAVVTVNAFRSLKESSEPGVGPHGTLVPLD